MPTLLQEMVDDILPERTVEHNKSLLSDYCELGIEVLKPLGSHEVYDATMACLKKAETKQVDPEFTRFIARVQRNTAGYAKANDTVSQAKCPS